MVAIGIDISKLKFDVACIIDDKKIPKTFENNSNGFSKLLIWLKDLHIENPRFCMEATGCYHYHLAEFLHNSGVIVSVVNSLQIKRFRESKLVRQKTDKSDDFVIAAFCEQNNPTAWLPKERENIELTEVNHHINNLKKELVRWKNRLEKDIVVIEVKNNILTKISELEEEIKIFEEKEKQIIQSSQNLSLQYKNLTGITGVGDRLATTVLSEMPDVSNFKTAGQYAAYVGITPSHFQSGSSVRGKSHISRIGNQCVRRVLFMAALIVKRHNKCFKDWVEKLSAEGKPPKVIVCAVMRKLICIILGMLKNGTAFNPQRAFKS